MQISAKCYHLLLRFFIKLFGKTCSVVPDLGSVFVSYRCCTSCHKFVVWNDTGLLSCSSGGQKSEMGVSGLHSFCRLHGKCFLAFSSSGGCTQAFLCSVFPSLIDTASSASLFHLYYHPCDFIGPIRIIQDNLPMSRSVD